MFPGQVEGLQALNLGRGVAILWPQNSLRQYLNNGLPQITYGAIV